MRAGDRERGCGGHRTLLTATTPTHSTWSLARVESMTMVQSPTAARDHKDSSRVSQNFPAARSCALARTTSHCGTMPRVAADQPSRAGSAVAGAAVKHSNDTIDVAHMAQTKEVTYTRPRPQRGTCSRIVPLASTGDSRLVRQACHPQCSPRGRRHWLPMLPKRRRRCGSQTHTRCAPMAGS